MNRNGVRVLYVWNTAGALTPVANWLLKNGHGAKIIMGKWFDQWGQTSKSPAAKMVDNPKEFISVVRQEIKNFKPTHIHVNSSLNGLVVSRALAPYTPILYQYHGSDIRGRAYVHPSVQLLADKHVVSTSDLVMYGEWWGCPVEEIFTYRGGREPGTALTILVPSVRYDFERQSKKYAKMRNLDLTIVDCRKGERVPHDELPEFLSRFEYYLDFKGVRIHNALSLVAKEAHAVGCKIIHDSDLSRSLTDFKDRTPQDYLKLYHSLKQPNSVLTAMRLFYALPREKLLS